MKKEFFGDLGKRFAEVADTAVEKTGQAVEIQKLKSRIRTQERRIDKDMLNLGRIIYEKYENGEVMDSDYSELCRDIDECKACIQELETEITEVQNKEI